MRSLLLILFLLYCGHLSAEETEPQIEKDTVITNLIDCSVSVLAGESQGSGIVFTKQRENQEYTFILTAAHNLTVLRSETNVITPDGIPRKLIKFDSPDVVNVLIINGNRLGEMRAKGTVIRYSAPGIAGDDLALLHIPIQNFAKSSARLYSGIPKIGSDLFHVGSMGGLPGAESLTVGILSQHGRKVGRNTFDQTTAPILFGSSGGLMSLQSNGQVVGVVAKMTHPVYNFIIPARRIMKWSKRTRIDWLFDEEQEMPPLNEIYSFPIEDIKR